MLSFCNECNAKVVEEILEDKVVDVVGEMARSHFFVPCVLGLVRKVVAGCPISYDELLILFVRRNI